MEKTEKKGGFFEQIEDDQFIEGKRFLQHIGPPVLYVIFDSLGDDLRDNRVKGFRHNIILI